MEKVNRGEWTPPPGERPARAAAPPPTFQVEASRVAASPQGPRRRPGRALEDDPRPPMAPGGRHGQFGPCPLDRIDFALADELVVELCEERLAIERARELGAPLMRTVRRPENRSHLPDAAVAGVSNGSIRKALDAAERVLRDASRARDPGDRGARPQGRRAKGRASTALVPRARADRRRPARRRPDRGRAPRADLGEGRRSSARSQRVRGRARPRARRLRHAGPQGAPRRALERTRRRAQPQRRPAPRRGRHAGPRRACASPSSAASTPRTSTSRALVCGFRGRPPRPTPANASSPPCQRCASGSPSTAWTIPAARDRPAFPTRNGTRQQPDNVRARILAPILERANELLEADGALPIAHLTPHTLRRTFASILAVCDVPPRRAMYLLGHTDPKLTLAVYQQVLDMRPRLGRRSSSRRSGARSPRRARSSAASAPRTRVSGTNPEPGTKKASAAGDARAGEA